MCRLYIKTAKTMRSKSPIPTTSARVTKMINRHIKSAGILLALLLIAIPVFAQTPQGAVTVTAAEIKATQAAVKKQGPRVPQETYRKIVPAYLTKSGELTPQGKAILGDESGADDSSAPTATPDASSSGEKGTKYDQLIGAWKTGTTNTANTYEFKSNGDVTRSYQSFTGADAKDTKYNKTGTEEFQVVQSEGKITVSPKQTSESNKYWFEIAVPFDPEKPAAIYYRVNGDKRSETPFFLTRATTEPKREESPAGRAARTIAKQATIFAPDKIMYLNQGSPVEISLDRTGLPEWAEKIIIKGWPGRPEEIRLFPKEWLTEGEAFDSKPFGTNPVFLPGKRLQSQYLEIAEPCFVPGPNGRNFVLMPGTRVRVAKRGQAGGQYGNVPGFEIHDGRSGLSAVLPASHFVNNGAGWKPLPPPVMATLAGNGSAQSPYLIRSRKDFDAFCQDPSKWAADVHTRLETDLDLSDTEFDDSLIAPYDPDDEFRFDEKPAFNGVLDGNGKTLAGLRIKTDRPFARLGLVYEIGESGIVRNLRLASADIQAAGLNGTAAVLCLENKGVVENCQSTGKVDFASRTGSLSSAGLCLNNAKTGKIIHSFVGGDGQTKINGWQSGGLCSVNEGLIERSGAEVEIRGSSSGGLVSSNQGGTLRECFSGGALTDSANVGGLCGKNSGVIENCFSRTKLDTEKKSGTSYVGGLVGKQTETEGVKGAVESSFWDTETTGAKESQGGTKISTAQAKDQAFFEKAGWDFKTVWSIGENGPELRNVAKATGE